MHRNLPSRLLVVTDRKLARKPLVDVVAQALAGGARWIWYRDRDLPPAERQMLGARLQDLCVAAGATLSVGGDAADARAMQARAVHLPAGGDPEAARTELGAGALIGVSAHTIAEADCARRAGADYVTFSPIFETSSKPGYGPAIGLQGLIAARRLGIPSVALGGVDVANATACLEAGAEAVAVMGAVMRAKQPRAAVEALLRAIEKSERAA